MAASVEHYTLARPTFDKPVKLLIVVAPYYKDIADQLVERGEVDHVWLGVAGTDITPEEATAMSIPGGATVTEVLDNSPASGGGLLAGDAIVAVDDDAVTSMNELVTELRDRSPGDEVTLTVVRNGDEVETTVELGER